MTDNNLLTPETLPTRAFESATPSAPVQAIFPGWYADPAGPGSERFWDGREWADRVREVTSASVSIDVTTVDTAILDLTGEGRLTHGEGRLTQRVSPVPEPDSVAEPASVDRVAPVRESFFRSISDATTPLDGPDVPSALAVPYDAASHSEPDTPVQPRAISLFTSVEASTPKPTEPLFAAARRVTVPVVAPPPATSAAPRGRSKLTLALLVLGVLSALALVIYAVVASTEQDSGSLGLTAGVQPTTASTAATTDVGISADAVVTIDARAVEDQVSAAGTAAAADLDRANVEITRLESLLEARDSELETIATERDSAVEHAQLMQTWFSDDVIEQSQADWDAEISRVCGLVAEGAELQPDLIEYTRPMEIIGSPGSLFDAIGNCVGP